MSYSSYIHDGDGRFYRARRFLLSPAFAVYLGDRDIAASGTGALGYG